MQVQKIRQCCALSLFFVSIYLFVGISAIREHDPIVDRDSALRYLVHYGYLSEKWLTRQPANGGLRSDPIKNALLKFQRMININETGDFDEFTIQAMNVPRCGVSDANSRNATADLLRQLATTLAPSANFMLFGTKWSTTNITYTITQYTNDIDHSTIDQAINDTLTKWASVTALRFIKVTKEPLMEIKWAATDHGDGESFDGPGGILAHSFFPPRRLALGQGLPGDVHFDDDDYWNVRPAQGRISLAHVSLHETGHAIGLDHSTDRDAVMYPFFTQSAMNREAKLTKDDIDGIRALYGPPDTSSSPVVTAEVFQGLVTQPSIYHRPETTAETEAPPTTSRSRCPFVPGVGVRAITQAADESDTTFALIGSNIYRLTDEGGVLPGYPKHISAILPEAPPAPTSLVTYVHTGSSFDRRYLYVFQGESYWRYEIKRSTTRNDQMKMLHGSSLLQMLVQQFLLGQQAENANAPTSRNFQDSEVELQFSLNSGYPKSITHGFKGIDAPGAVIFQLVTDELVYFVTSTQYWTFSPLQSGNSTALPLSEHPVLRSLPIRPPLLQAAMVFNGRNYFFASNGSYWVWSPSRNSAEAGAFNLNNENNDRIYDAPRGFIPNSYSRSQNGDPGRWSIALSISEWWFGCNR